MGKDSKSSAEFLLLGVSQTNLLDSLGELPSELTMKSFYKVS